MMREMKSVAGKMKPEPAADRAATPAALERWSPIDTAVLIALTAITAATRFWRLGYPDSPVFDEGNFVGQAGTYLRGEQYIDPHPPLARELMALGMWAFGPAHSWAWRFSVAAVGTSLVAVTYLLGRRLFASRLAAALGASFIILDGLFLVDSRTGVLEVVYLALAALSYLLLFVFLQDFNHGHGRRTLLWLGISLGLCLGAKLLLPGVTFLLVMAFLGYGLWVRAPRQRNQLVLGASLLVGFTAALGYIAAFMPNYLFLHWGGVQALWHYVSDVLWYEGRTFGAFDNRASPWWSWPLLLHPFIYWKDTLDSGDLSIIWFGPNPIVWWASLAAIGIYAIRLISRPNMTGAFLVSGYLAYLLIEIGITRPMYIYHYMPSQYLAYVALGAILSECWQGRARPWEQALIVAGLLPSVALAIGGTQGLIAMGLLIAVAGVMLWRSWNLGQPLCAAVMAGGLAAFVYFYPIWTGLPISSAALDARMWLHQTDAVSDWSSFRN